MHGNKRSFGSAGSFRGSAPRTNKVFRKGIFKKDSDNGDYGYDSGDDRKVFFSKAPVEKINKDRAFTTNTRTFSSGKSFDKFGRNTERSFSSGNGRSFSSGNGGGRSFGGGRSSGGRNRGGGGRRGDFINESMFVNKGVLQEEEKYVPTNNFADFEINQILKDNIISKGYTSPSPIQDKSIPVGLTGKDIIGIASTGTGKTAAFLIPIINTILNDKSRKAIILAPTRELALQIDAEFMSFAKGLSMYSAVCVGGSPIFAQISKLQRGVNLIIGTPGRVQDLIDRRKIRTSDYSIAVLDEADRMLDMGFIDDMRAILGGMAQEKQSFFFSATFSPEIKRLCMDFLKDPETVEIKSRATSDNVDQDVVRVKRGGTHKIDALHDILINPEATKVLVFSETKRSVDDLSEELIERGFRASALHGDMRNRAREGVVRDLKSSRIQIVVATDVAARGIDIKDITHVINYEIPQNYETYIHRIGRTGRAGKLGKALTFVYESSY